MTERIRIRSAGLADLEPWGRMRYALWPGEDEHHDAEISRYFAGGGADPQYVLLAEVSDGPIAFAELSIRTDLPGWPEQRVGYIEGLYVKPHMRRRGVAQALIAASRMWAREHRCAAFASDRADRVIFDRSFRSTGS